MFIIGGITLKIVIFIGMILSMFFLFGCSGGNGEDNGGSNGELKEFSIDVFNWDFEPREVRVNQGDTVKLTFTLIDNGTDNTGHGVALPSFGLNTKNLHKDESETLEFVADKKGTFPFVCSIWCGEGHGDMKGKVVVE